MYIYIIFIYYHDIKHSSCSVYIYMVAIPLPDTQMITDGDSAWKNEVGSLLMFSHLLLPLFRELIEG